MSKSEQNLALTDKETAILEKELDTWPTLSRREKADKKNELIAQFLKGRKRDVKDEYNQAVMFQVCYDSRYLCTFGLTARAENYHLVQQSYPSW